MEQEINAKTVKLYMLLNSLTLPEITRLANSGAIVEFSNGEAHKVLIEVEHGLDIVALRESQNTIIQSLKRELQEQLKDIEDLKRQRDNYQ